MRAISIGALLLLAGLAACGDGQSAADKAREEAIEGVAASQGHDVDASVKGDSMSITVNEGGEQHSATFNSNGKLPDDFPADMPIYPGMKVQSSIDVPQGQMVSATTGDDPAKVAEFYSRKLEGNGWKQAAEVRTDAMHALSFEKGERKASVTVIGGEGEHTVQLTLSGS